MKTSGGVSVKNEQHRHDVTDKEWALIAPLIPGKPGEWGSVGGDNRSFINGVFWVLRTGAPWRDMPPSYGKWGTVYQRFNRWRTNGTWEAMLEKLIDEPDFEWLMIDATHCKVHPHAAGAIGGNDEMGRTKGGLTPRYIWPWMRMVCRSERLSQAVPPLIVSKLSR